MAEFTEEELAAEAATGDGSTESTISPTEDNSRQRDEMGRFVPQQQEDGQPQDRQRQVSHGALHAERESHKATKAELQAAREQLGRIAEMRARIMSTEPEKPAATNAEDDPTGIKYLTSRVEQLSGTVHQREQATQANELQGRENQLLFGQLNQSEIEFRNSTPDYDQAAGYLANARAQELSMYGLQPHEIQAQLAEEVLEITRSAIAMGRSPAELAYQIAKTRGYNGQAQQQGNPTANAMLDAIAAGNKSKSLSSARGGGGSADPNANAIASMSDEEFAKAMRDPAFAQLVEGLG